MEPYNDAAKCAKCGHDRVLSRYIEGVSMGVGLARVSSPDYIRRTCDRCQFGWSEEPIDRGVLRSSAQ